MKYEKKFRSQEEQQQTHSETQAHESIREFASPEEMLRLDAKQTAVPDSVAQRLSRSLKREPPASSWWKRLFS